MLDGKKILITGGTGSLGQALTKRLLATNVDTIRIFSRTELKQIQMEEKFNDPRLRFLIGDIREKSRLHRALEDIDLVIHAAALKHVPIAEYNPFEAVKTNVYGAQNLIDSCLDSNVKKVVAIGTDKAVSPFNTYGATKFLMERLFISSNYFKGARDIDFLCVRYGNVLGSSGSIVPKFVGQIKNQQSITITDPSMTRFNITMNQALDLIFRAMENGCGGEIFVPKLKAYDVGTMKDSVVELMNSDVKVQKINVRPGEKYHESLISTHELRNTFENNDDYVIIEEQIRKRGLECLKSLNQTTRTDEYSSNNVPLLSKSELKDILVTEKLLPLP